MRLPHRRQRPLWPARNRRLGLAAATRSGRRGCVGRALPFPWRPVEAVLEHMARTVPGGTPRAELDVLTRLCGQSPQQLEDLLDQLVRSRLLADWRHISDEEISWRLPSQIAVGRTAVQQRWHGCQLRRSKPCRSSCALCSMTTPCW